jgi:hypothetical protein
VLEAAFVLLEFSSPSRRIFIGSHSLPPSLVRRIGPSLYDRCHGLGLGEGSGLLGSWCGIFFSRCTLGSSPSQDKSVDFLHSTQLVANQV